MKLKANIVTLSEPFFGEIEFDQKIISLTKIDHPQASEDWIYPGAIDLHVHGGGGGDFMQDESQIRTILRTHLKLGTTGLLATTVTDSPDQLEETFQNINSVIKNQKNDEARILGIHLEGPFIDPHKLGAQPDCARAFDMKEILKLHKISPIKIITLAPESGLSLENIRELQKNHIMVQLGHSNASYEEVLPMIEAGAKSFTHLYNAMSGLHHRQPGMVGAALAHAHFAELIPDLLHVHPGAIKVALRSIPHLYFVTDSTAATGMPDGKYKLGTHQVRKCQNGIRLKDRTLARSCLSMSKALRNALSLNLLPHEVASKISTIAARLLSIRDRGDLAVGKRADLLILNPQHQLKNVFLEGSQV